MVGQRKEEMPALINLRHFSPTAAAGRASRGTCQTAFLKKWIFPRRRVAPNGLHDESHNINACIERMRHACKHVRASTANAPSTCTCAPVNLRPMHHQSARVARVRKAEIKAGYNSHAPATKIDPPKPRSRRNCSDFHRGDARIGKRSVL